ncbi:5'-AMP-activated protein kinase regulatory beta subunit protein [Dioscorea alata]|uniref:5'-AMP-activated protein kinase regulatory beta subunit protein n=1 Tax=Dioscorea alata TaxID=55571 RepID=A0ACB7V2E5_DIOAL|nr:5'-AMP-activated protein kinase regulatory beta subunit protein [Dioscorea alata]
MGNAGAKVAENGAGGPDEEAGSDGEPRSDGVRRVGSSDSIDNTPPESPGRSRSPLMFAPQVPVAPLVRGAEISPFFSQLRMNDSHGTLNAPLGKGVPTMIIWSHGGNEVLVEGSWDNWTARKAMYKSGMEHSILMVLPSGVYRYRFIVDGEQRYIPDLPHTEDEMGFISNLLDVHEYVPDDLQSVSEFEPPPSPDSTYNQRFPADEDFAKEPLAVPPHLHLTVLGKEEPATKPPHVILNHLFIERGWAAQSLVALGLTHRFQSKYVTVVLYKPMLR